MSELQGLLDREAHPGLGSARGARVRPAPSADRRRRNRRIRSAVLALVLAAVAISTLVKAFEPSEPKPARWPKITLENVARASSWLGPRRNLVDAARRRRFPATASTWQGRRGSRPIQRTAEQGGMTCAPIWFGTVTDVTHRPVTTTVDYKADHLEAPVVSDGMVFSVDKHHLYAFPVDCATDGATCQPSWFAVPPTPKYPPTLPVVADGLVFIGTGDGHLFGYPTHCGTGAMVCEPTWIAHG